ncbi:hypothetical protein Q4S25_21850, partial [Morganella morganii]
MGKGERVFSFNNSEDQYTLNEEIKHAKIFRHVYNKKLQYYYGDNTIKKLSYISINYKFTTENNLIHMGNSQYREKYQYKKEGGQLEEAWYMVNKKPQCHC